MSLLGETRKEKWMSLILFLTGFTLPFHRNLNTVCGLIFVLGALFFADVKKAHIKKFLPFLILYGFAGISLLWDKYPAEGSVLLFRQIFIFLFPAAMFLYGELKEKSFQSGMAGLVSGVITASVICLIGAGLTFLHDPYPGFFFYHHLAGQIGISALYLSLLVVVAILHCLFLFLSLEKSRYSSYLLLCLFYLSAMAFMLICRSSLIALFLTILFTAFYYRKAPGILILNRFFLITAFTGILAGLTVPIIRERILEAINYRNQYTLEKAGGGTSFRKAKWEACIKLLEANWLTGYGTGDIQNQLNNQYLIDKHPQVLDFNAHNQYFQTWLGLGITGLLLLLTCLVSPLSSGGFRDFHHIGIIVIFSVCIITESMLQTQKGVFFFAFLFSLLAGHRPYHSAPRKLQAEDPQLMKKTESQPYS